MPIIENSIRVLATDGERVVAEVTQQEGGTAAALKVSCEDWLTPTELESVASICQQMASRLRGVE